MTILRVSECFGPTVQGEGPSTGRPAVFLRLAGCNLDCSFCDTPFTWDWTGKNGVAFDRDAETHPTDVNEVADWVNGHVGETGVDLLVVTGGEPTLQSAALVELAMKVKTSRVEVETNGTHRPSDALLGCAWVWWNVSPKLANSGVAAARAIRPDVLGEFAGTGRAVFKFVVADLQDLDEVATVVTLAHIPTHSVWIMPEGDSPEAVTRRPLAALANATLAHGWNFTHRLHLLIWGSERGH